MKHCHCNNNKNKLEGKVLLFFFCNTILSLRLTNPYNQIILVTLKSIFTISKVELFYRGFDYIEYIWILKSAIFLRLIE